MQARHRAPSVCKYVASGSISLPSPGFFSPFPHGTGSLSVVGEYLALRDGPRRFTRDCTCPVLLRCHQGRLPSFAYRAVTVYGQPFQAVLLEENLVTPCEVHGPHQMVLQPRFYNAHKLDIKPVWADPVSLVATKGIDISFFYAGY